MSIECGNKFQINKIVYLEVVTIPVVFVYAKPQTNKVWSIDVTVETLPARDGFKQRLVYIRLQDVVRQDFYLCCF